MAISNKAVSHHLERLAGRVKQARLDANLTQRALADLIGVSPKTISNAEDSGQVSLETLVRLLDGLGRINELALLLEDPGPSPIELAKRKGRQKQRVRARRGSAAETGEDWQW